MQRRVDLMVSEGIEFQTGVTIGKDISASQLLDDFDAVVLCLGSTWPRDLTIPGTVVSCHDVDCDIDELSPVHITHVSGLGSRCEYAMSCVDGRTCSQPVFTRSTNVNHQP